MNQVLLSQAIPPEDWVAEVEPTNNAVEWALRPAVVARKLSFGTHSAKGSRFTERMLSVVTTCRQQGRAVFALLVETVQAAWQGLSAPVLVIAPEGLPQIH